MSTNGLLGIKLEQTQIFNDAGMRIPVTKISAGPCRVLSIGKLSDQDDYFVQVGFGTTKITTKAMMGHIKGAGLKAAPRFICQFRVDSQEEFQVGQEINVVDIFKPGDTIKITGVSKGKGFAGVVKRHHFRGGPKTHGQSDRQRSPGSIGSATTPGRVYKGKKMAGRMGGETVSIKGLKVISVDKENNLLVVSGLVPGGKNGLLTILKA